MCVFSQFLTPFPFKWFLFKLYDFPEFTIELLLLLLLVGSLCDRMPLLLCLYMPQITSMRLGILNFNYCTYF